MKQALSLIHSSPVVADSDRITPRIGVLRARAAPPAARRKYTVSESPSRRDDAAA